MLAKLGRRLTYANIVSTLALFIVLGGSAYAITVHGNDIVNRSIPRHKVRINALTGREIHEPAVKVLQGLERVQAETASDSASTKDRFVACPSGKFAVGGGAAIYSTDASGEPQLNTDQDLALSASQPTGSGLLPNFNMWYARATETDAVSGNWKLFVYVLCANNPA